MRIILSAIPHLVLEIHCNMEKKNFILFYDILFYFFLILFYFSIIFFLFFFTLFLNLNEGDGVFLGPMAH